MNNSAYSYLGTPLSKHNYDVLELRKKYNWISKKTTFFKRRTNVNTKLFYCVFISNLYNNLSWLEKFNIPFVFTLYPGGGFEVNNPEVDRKLRLIFSSSNFKKVIVTQFYTKQYLENNNLCDKDKICLIYGCVVPQKSLEINLQNKKYYLKDKDTFDICFCA